VLELLCTECSVPKQIHTRSHLRDSGVSKTSQERAVQHRAAFASGQPWCSNYSSGETSHNIESDTAEPIFRRLNPALHSQV